MLPTLRQALASRLTSPLNSSQGPRMASHSGLRNVKFFTAVGATGSSFPRGEKVPGRWLCSLAASVFTPIS